MDHRDHVRLIQRGISKEKSQWADFGSGEGAFTLALADLLPDDSIITSIDKNKQSLLIQQEKFKQQFPQKQVHFIATDFTADLSLKNLDGIIMANSLHFIETEKQVALLQKIRTYLKPQGKLIIIEYNSDSGNIWVPFPFRFDRFRKMAKNAGFKKVQLLNTIYSTFLNEIYACEASN